MEYDEATLTVTAERGRIGPKGLFGGLEGACFKSTVTKPDGRVIEMPSKGAAAVVHNGDRVRIHCAGSGGYGDPLGREPERVLNDVRGGYVTAQSAREYYGVALADGGRQIDHGATLALRQHMRAARNETRGVSVAAE